MGFQDYIGESEACAFAGISATTLKRFAEAGYFQIETDADGLRLFSKSEIEKLFGLKPRTTPRSRTAPAETGVDIYATTATAFTPPSSHIGESEVPPTTKRATTVVREPVSRGPIESAPLEAPAPQHPSPNQSTSPLRTHTPEPLVTHPTVLSDRSAAIDALEEEVTKLRNVVSLQEKLLDMREEEVRGLKGERDWLRSRIEKLEEKNERDQLLLLAETQTVRQLINLQQKKRSGVQLALEWLGFKSPAPAPGEPIDISPGVASN